MINKLYLIDREPELVDAWQSAFKQFDEVETLVGDYFQKPASVMVSPANSFGFMDGGLDYAIRERLGVVVEKELQRRIIDTFHGELPVGHCLTVETGHSGWPYLAAIPTMRVPGVIQGTLNVYYAFRALLLEGSMDTDSRFESVVCPGLGTGIGGMSPKDCAGQMAYAYEQFKKDGAIPSAREVLRAHHDLERYQSV